MIKKANRRIIKHLVDFANIRGIARGLEYCFGTANLERQTRQVEVPKIPEGPESEADVTDDE